MQEDKKKEAEVFFKESLKKFSDFFDGDLQKTFEYQMEFLYKECALQYSIYEIWDKGIQGKMRFKEIFNNLPKFNYEIERMIQEKNES